MDLKKGDDIFADLEAELADDLDEIDLDNEQLFCGSTWQQFRNLHTLLVPHNFITNLPYELLKVTSLQKLEVSNNPCLQMHDEKRAALFTRSNTDRVYVPTLRSLCATTILSLCAEGTPMSIYVQQLLSIIASAPSPPESPAGTLRSGATPPVGASAQLTSSLSITLPARNKAARLPSLGNSEDSAAPTPTSHLSPAEAHSILTKLGNLRRYLERRCVRFCDLCTSIYLEAEATTTIVKKATLTHNKHILKRVRSLVFVMGGSHYLL